MSLLNNFSTKDGCSKKASPTAKARKRRRTRAVRQGIGPAWKEAARGWTRERVQTRLAMREMIRKVHEKRIQ